MIYSILLVIIAISFLLEIPTYAVYGWLIKDKLVMKALDKAYKDSNGITLNPYNESILTIGTLPFISIHYSIFSYYYINGVGRISRFGKSHKRIKHSYNLLKGTREQRIKRKLNIN